MRTSRTLLSLLAAVGTLSLVAPLARAQEESKDDDAKQATPAPKDEVDPRWLDRLPEADRALVEEFRGYAPPEMPDGLEWIGTEPKSWDDLRGRVVIVQSWTNRSSLGRSAPLRAAKALEAYDESDYVVLALHTPDNAEHAKTYLNNRPLDMPVILDSTGHFCDEFGFYQRPANALIDRNGVVRYAGLNARGLEEAAKKLLAEPHDPDATPAPRPSNEAGGAAGFPAVEGQVANATDFRGRRAPEFFVSQWITSAPDARQKVVIIDFWATWCGPCIKAIPHMNDLQVRHPNDVVVVGLSDESAATVANFQRQTPMRYAVATDQMGRMKRALGITGIPHVLVVSGDWTVRWQGHPARLTGATLDEIVEANKRLVESAVAGQRYRWTGDSNNNRDG